MNVNFTGFENPFLEENAEQLYTEMYGEEGVGFMKILTSSPKEMAVISRLLMYLQKNA